MTAWILRSNFWPLSTRIFVRTPILWIYMECPPGVWRHFMVCFQIPNSMRTPLNKSKRVLLCWAQKSRCGWIPHWLAFHPLLSFCIASLMRNLPPPLSQKLAPPWFNAPPLSLSFHIKNLLCTLHNRPRSFSLLFCRCYFYWIKLRIYLEKYLNIFL